MPPFLLAPDPVGRLAQSELKRGIAALFGEFEEIDLAGLVERQILIIELRLTLAVFFRQDPEDLRRDRDGPEELEHAHALVALFDIVAVHVLIGKDRIVDPLAQMGPAQVLPFVGKLRALVQQRHEVRSKGVDPASVAVPDDKIGRDLDDAEIDGADNLTTFVRIVVPLSRPIMAVMVVFSMVAYWNDWFTALIYLQKTQYPFPLVLRGILITTEAMTSMTGGLSYAESNRIAELVKFAAMIVAAVPMLVMYPFVQKYFEQGFMTGAVKG